MKISKLIKQLVDQMSEHGDMPVVLRDKEGIVDEIDCIDYRSEGFEGTDCPYIQLY